MAAHKAWADDPHNRDRWRDIFDADAEFRLRGKSPPAALVWDEIKTVLKLAGEMAKRIDEDPILRERFETERREELEAIARKLHPKARH